jgi:hypothetical protein
MERKATEWLRTPEVEEYLRRVRTRTSADAEEIQRILDRAYPGWSKQEEE